jgi:hypothetical protein
MNCSKALLALLYFGYVLPVVAYAGTPSVQNTAATDKNIVIMSQQYASYEGIRAENTILRESKEKAEKEAQALKEALSSKQPQTGSIGNETMADHDVDPIYMKADGGESVYFKGVGESKMLNVDGKTVLRFSTRYASAADKLLLPRDAERHEHGAYVYYIIDQKDLVL